MLERAMKKTEAKPKRNFKVKYCVIATVVAMAIPTTIFADEIKNTFYNILGKDEKVSEYVVNDIYTDSTENLKVTVKELLSDKINSYAVVEYEALTEKGIESLEGLDKMLRYGNPFDDNIFDHTLICIEPDIKDDNTLNYGVNYSFKTSELMQYRTENKRVYSMQYNASGDNFGTDNVKINYELESKSKEVTLKCTKYLDYKEIKLDSSKAPDKTYKPTGVKLSTFSIFVYGENCGQYEAGINKYGWSYVRSLSDEEVESIYLIMKDDTKMDVLALGGSMLCSVTNPDVDYDIEIFTACFGEYINTDDVAGIEIDGIYYSFG